MCYNSHVVVKPKGVLGFVPEDQPHPKMFRVYCKCTFCGTRNRTWSTTPMNNCHRCGSFFTHTPEKLIIKWC